MEMFKILIIFISVKNFQNSTKCIPKLSVFIVHGHLHGSQSCYTEGADITQRSNEPCHAQPPKMDRS